MHPDILSRSLHGKNITAPCVSVIIPNLNSKIIDRTVESLLSQTAVQHIAEILVVGLDQTGLVVENEPVRFISTGTPVSAPVARNAPFLPAGGPNSEFTVSSRRCEYVFSGSREPR